MHQLSSVNPYLIYFGTFIWCLPFSKFGVFPLLRLVNEESQIDASFYALSTYTNCFLHKSDFEPLKGALKMRKDIYIIKLPAEALKGRI